MRLLSLTHLLPLRPLRILCALVAVVLLACSQGEGETCQTDRDCDDGLLCVKAASSPRSVCRSPEDIEPDAGGVDAGEPDLPDDEDAGGEPEHPDASDPDASDDDASGEPADEDAGG